MAYKLLDDEHYLWRQSIRDFVNKEIVPDVEAWEEATAFDPGLFKKLGKMGYLGISFPSEYGGGNKDFIFEIKLCEEISRATSGGLATSIMVHTKQSL